MMGPSRLRVTETLWLVVVVALPLVFNPRGCVPYSLNYHLTGAIMQIALNGSDEPLQPGDVAVFSGINSSPEAGGMPIVQVSRTADASSTAVAGVVFSRFNIQAVSQDARPEGWSVEGPVEVTPSGSVAPGEYLLLVVQGPVKVRATASSAAIEPGDLLSTAASPGYATQATEFSLGDMRAAQPGTVFGKALEPLDAGQEGLIYTFVTLH